MNFLSTVEQSPLSSLFPKGWDLERIEACCTLPPETASQRQGFWHPRFETLPCGDVEAMDVMMGHAVAALIRRAYEEGKPIALLLMMEHATITVCHSRTKNLAEKVSRADIVVAAIGKPEMVRGSWIKEGAVVIDVGVNRTDAGLKGDVEFEEASKRASLITPVPGGVGPMTITMLLENTLIAARARMS